MISRRLVCTRATLIAEERRVEAGAALAAARERHRITEADYAAWKLLQETLIDAHRQETQHLGRILAEPVASQFRELAGAQYEGVSLSTDLSTEGVVVAGATRPRDRLSVGTREQLATLFRRALARQVGSLVILDDQLVQSDRQRMAWFSTLLRAVGRSIQVIVLTCRVADYVDDERLAAGSAEPVQDWPDLVVRAVDLGRMLNRL